MLRASYDGVKMLSMRPDKLQTITPDNFRHLAKDFNVTLSEEFTSLDKGTQPFVVCDG